MNSSTQGESFGLKAATIQRIHEVLSHYPQVEQALIYGSRAKGSYKEGSDIDMTLKGKSLNLQTLAAVYNELDDLLLPYMIDLSIYHHIDNQDLIDHIERIGKVFYAKSP